ncbi:MAG: response regulator [Betaproteobacteria bacterium]|nr:response regulator [Betaproteobacteria bacterium]
MASQEADAAAGATGLGPLTPSAPDETPVRDLPFAPSASSATATDESGAIPTPRAPFNRHVAVEGRGSGDATAGEGWRAVRARRHRALLTAAARSGLEQMHVVGWLVLALVPLLGLVAADLWRAAPVWLWAAAAGTLGGVMVAWPRRRWRASASSRRLTLLVGAAALLAAAPAALLPPLASAADEASTWVWLVAAFAVAVGATVAPSAPAAGAMAFAPPLAAALALRPLLAAGLPAAAVAAPLAAAGLWGGVLAWGVAWHLRRGWRRQMLLGLEQAARLREAETARDAALRADADKSRFLAIASHDLRQPVHALGLFAATLHKRLHASPDEALARNLMRSVDGLERSFNAMLDISRLDGDAVTPRSQTFPLRDIFRRLHMQYAGQAELAGLALRFSPGGKSVTSDPQLLERIVGNLVHNAIRYTTHGGIAVVARSTHTHINIEVWDTGAGIAAADLPRIFDEFFQVGRGERDRSQGLGMGLAIVKRLAALLGHRLEVASAPGRGTLFRVGVPVGTLGGFDDEVAPADTLPMSVDVAQMVLVVDDEEPIREGLRLLLQEWGYQAMTAADLVQAERAVSALEGRVDLILSDLHLGGGAGGREVVASVRRLCGREVPAILVTGDTAGQALREVVAGTDPVLFKPVQPRQLFEAMRAALQ